MQRWEPSPELRHVSGGDAQGSQWLVASVLEHQPSGEQVERSKTCPRVLRDPTVLTEGEASAEGESLGWPSLGGQRQQGCGRDVTEGSTGAGTGHRPRHRAAAAQLTCFPPPGEEEGMAGASPRLCQALGTNPGHRPPQSPLPWPRCRPSCAGRDGPAQGAVKTSEALWRKRKEGQREAGKRPCLVP